MAWSRKGPANPSCVSLVFSVLALLACVHAAVDEAADFSIVDATSNIISASNPGQAELASSFGGDANRFARRTSSLGSLQYEEEQGIDEVSVTIFALTSPAAGAWQFTITVGSKDVLVLGVSQLQEALAATTVRTCIHSTLQAYN
jgi:hypothetical protein